MLAKILATIVICLAFAWVVALWLAFKGKRWELALWILSGVLAAVIVLMGVMAIWE